MKYQVMYTKQAAKTLLKMPVGAAHKIQQRIDLIAEDPFSPHQNLTKLQDREGYRLRVGDWRIIYSVQKDKVLIMVLKIGLRKEVYR